MASLPVKIVYSGNGHMGVWSDPANWVGGVVPGATSTAIFNSSATLNGGIEVNNLMLLGAETVTIHGQIKTDNTNVCQSFMACEGAVVNFTAGSSLLDAGGFVTGIDADATVTLAGASGGQKAANITVTNMKIGQADDGSGTLTLAGGIANDTGAAYIGLEGTGVLNVTNNGQGNFTGLILGSEAGAVGTVNVSGGGTVYAAGWALVGTAAAGAPGGVGIVNVGAGGTFSCDHGISVGAGSSIALAGGTIMAGPDGNGLNVQTGGAVTGFGAIQSPAKSVSVNGLLASSGGTLAITGNINGLGQVHVGAGSTLDLVASHIVLSNPITFMGANATLDLVTGVSGSFTIAGFGATDHIVMTGIDAANWNAASGILTLTDHGQTVEHLSFTGIAAGASFAVAASSTGDTISLTGGTGGLFSPSHH
jgi:hypothetical protein